MAFLKKIQFWKKRKNTPTKVDACVSTEDTRTSDAATVTMDPTNVDACVSTETQITRRTLQDTHREEKMALMQENRKLKNDIRIQRVSFVYVQTNVQCCQVLLFVVYLRIVQVNFVSLPTTSWVNFEAVLI